MSITTMFEDVTSERNATIPSILVQSTGAGYDVRTTAPHGDRAELIERVAAITGLTLVALAAAGIYVGRAYQLQGLGTGSLLAGAVLLTGGVAYLWISARGMRHMAHFDTEKRELQYMTRNRLGSTRVLRSVGFDDITETLIEPASAPGRPARLLVRVGAGDGLIDVARGSDDELDGLRDRISKDLPGAFVD